MACREDGRSTICRCYDDTEEREREKERKHVLMLLGELGDVPWYFAQRSLDSLVTMLCEKLQAIADVTKYSLEMQIWWRDHKSEDRARLEEEAKQHKTEAERAAALAKLTPYERELLGV